MSRKKQAAALVTGILLALFLCAGEARAQSACAPTQTVSATADADGVYTTTLVCADTSAAAGEADYERIYYNQGASAGSPSSPANNNDRNAYFPTA